MAEVKKLLRTLRGFLRGAFGEDDYSGYRGRMEVSGIQPMTPAAFYLSQLRRKYSRPQRCC